MFRLILLPAIRQSSRGSATVLRQRQLYQALPIRFYSSLGLLTKELVTERILEILEDYDNVKNVDKISETAHFSRDLGLDSLDQVEVLMEVENEFSILIPDDDADNLKTVDQTINYILEQPDAC